MRDVATKEPYPWAEKRGQRVCDLARGEGVLLRPLGNVIVIMPPLRSRSTNSIAFALQSSMVSSSQWQIDPRSKALPGNAWPKGSASDAQALMSKIRSHGEAVPAVRLQGRALD